MDILLYFLPIPVILVIIIKAIVSDSGNQKTSTVYRYNRKYVIMTEREQEFYKKLKEMILESIKNGVK